MLTTSSEPLACDPGSSRLYDTHTIRCPHCDLSMPWNPQPVRILVRCPNAEGMRKGVAVYAGDGHAYTLPYLPKPEAKERCGAIFAIRAAKPF